MIKDGLMDNQYLQHLVETMTGKDNLKLCREEALALYKSQTVTECFDTAMKLYASEHFQIQDIAVFLCGYVAVERADALSFLKDIVSNNPNWKVQEVLAMAFDAFCKAQG